MATTMHNTMSQGVSTLDVLWAFYLSQPKQVKKAFRARLENQDKAESGALGFFRGSLLPWHTAAERMSVNIGKVLW